MSRKKDLKDQMNAIPHFDKVADYENKLQEIDEGEAIDLAFKHSKLNAHHNEGEGSISKNITFQTPRPKGPMDLYFSATEQKGKGKSKEEQLTLEKCRKHLRDRAVQLFSRWMYDAGLSFNAVRYDSFGAFIEAIGQYGPGMKPPSYHEVRVPCLNKELENTKSLLKDHDEYVAKCGRSLMADGWKDRKGRTLIGFLINCPKGSMFLESVDVSLYSKTGERMYDLLSRYIERVGEQNAIQVVTDNTSENVLAGRLLEAKFRHIYWTPCAARCLDLIFEDLFELPILIKTVTRAVSVNVFIYGRILMLNLMRMFT